MVQKIQQANVFGRLGHSIGEALADQVPREIERNRLASGLKELGNKKGLTPFQQFSELASQPGITPQMIQTGGELLKQQQIRNAYKNRANRLTQTEEQPQNQQFQQNQVSPLSAIQFAQTPGQLQRTPQGQQPTIPQNVPREQEAQANPPAASQNPLQQQFIPSGPWTQNHQEQAINEAFDRGFATNFDEAAQYANQQKQIFESTPEKYRAQLEYKKGVDAEVDALFDKNLETRLQKEGKETYADLTGDMQLNLKKQARNAVATGKMTPEQSAEYYTKKSLDLVKAKGRAKEIANRDIFDRILPDKKEEALKNLIHVGKTYKDLGSSEEYYNFLRDRTQDESGILGLAGFGTQNGMGLSPGGAAIIAYPRSPKVQEFIKGTRIAPKNIRLARGVAEDTRAFAEGLINRMSPDDSFLAIARQMKQQDPEFDEYAFFDYLRENQDRYGSNPRLNQEVSQGVSDFYPNWRDIGLFPAFTKSVAND